MGDEQLLTGVYIDGIRECARHTAEHIPVPWRATYSDPAMNGNHFQLRAPGPGIRISGFEYDNSRVIVDYLNNCGPDTIIKLCNEIEGLRRMLNAKEAQ